MGKIYDTTDFVGTSIEKKSKLGKNFEIKDNYWIESLQHDVNHKWNFTSNRVDVEEEVQRFNDDNYVKAHTHYQNIEVRLNKVYDDHGKQLSPDFKQLIFRDINHKTKLGKKYRFDQENFNQNNFTDKDVWLTINKNITDFTANVIIKRCNAMLGFLVKNYTEEWYEPVSLDYDAKYTIQYLNQVINVPSAQAYATVQFNEYTKNIAINDRFILGAINFDDISNNSVFKVKEIFRFGTLEKNNPNSIPLIILALEADVINESNDYIFKDENGKYHYIADYYIYKNQKADNDIIPFHEKEIDDYYLKMSSLDHVINQGENKDFTCNLFNGNGEPIDSKINFTLTLEGPKCPENYFGYKILDDNTIRIFNKKKYFKSDLVLNCELEDNKKNVSNLIFKIQLGDAI